MKKLIISLLLLTPMLAGCANVDTRVTLNDNNSASVVTSLTYKGNLADETDINAVNIISNYTKFLDNSYKVDTAFNNNLSTITASKEVRNVKFANLDLSSLGIKTNLPDNKYIAINKNFLITSYNIVWEYNYKDQLNNLEIVKNLSVAPSAPKSTLNPEYYHKYGDKSEMEPPTVRDDDLAANLDDDTKKFVQDSMNDIEEKETVKTPEAFQTSFSIKLPSFASFNNADSVEGNIYTWNIKKDGPTIIKLQYVRYSGFAIGIVLGFAVLLLVLLARKIVKHDSQKRMDNNDKIV